MIPSNLLERLALLFGVVPEPLVMTQMAYTNARAIMAGCDLGVFDALENGPLSVRDIARQRSLDVRALSALLGALVGGGYLSYEADPERYALKPVAKKWLLSSSKQTLANKLIFQKMEWEVVGGLEEFVRTGKAQDFHGHGTTAEEWSAYQLGMADLGRLSLPEAVRRTPIPEGARAMLDIGGSGGTYSAAFLGGHPELSSRILDLPDAVGFARPLVEAQGLGDRLRIEAGNALEVDIGEGLYDFVFMGNVSHHLHDADNRTIVKKAARALRPGGVFCILEIEKTATPSTRHQVGTLLDLYFSMTSASGTWTVDVMESWLAEAGLEVGKAIRFRTSPGFVEVWGTRR